MKEIIIRKRIVCKVRTQDPENFEEEVKSLVTACWFSVIKSQSFNTSLWLYINYRKVCNERNSQKTDGKTWSMNP